MGHRVRGVVVAALALGAWLSAGPSWAVEAPGLRALVSNAIRDHAARRWSLPTPELRVSIISLLPELDARSVVGVREAPGGASEDGGDRGVFGVTVDRGNRLTETVWVTARIERLVPVAVAGRTLSHHQMIAEGDVVHELRPVSLRSEGSPPPALFVGKRTIRGMARGTVLDLDDVEDAPVIRRGETVTLIVDHGGMRIAAKGRAKEDGYPGRQVAVVNVDSRKTVYGEVLKNGAVAVLVGP